MNVNIRSAMIPNAVHAVSHPLVADLYIKKEYSREKPYNSKDILVVEANFSERVLNHREYRALLSELFMALPEIKGRVEGDVGPVDRIDIKTH